MPTDKANVVWQYPQAADLFTALAKDQEVDARRQVEARRRRTWCTRSTPCGSGAQRHRRLGGARPPSRSSCARLGFTVVGTGNAPATVARTTVTYPAGLESKAAVLASRLPNLRPTADGSAAAGVVTLVVGPELKIEDVA